MLLYTDTFNYLMFLPSELGSKDLNDYKNSKAEIRLVATTIVSYRTCSNLCILKDEYRKFKLLNDSFDITLDNLEMSAKIRWYHCNCITGMGETCNHVAASMFRVEAVVGTGLTHPSCTSSVNE